MGICNSKNIKSIHPKLESKIFVLGIIDMQNDFLEFGSLPIKNSNEIIGSINKLRFMMPNNINTFISLDTHPHNHISFAETHNKKPFETLTITSKMKNGDMIETNQTLWPTHCVINTSGQEINPNLLIKSEDLRIGKGTLYNVESYSAFGDENNNIYENTGLDIWLKNNNCTDLVLVGVATDYCVYNTALDAFRYGYNVHIILSCVRGVDALTTYQAIEDLRSKGAHIYDKIEDFLSYMDNFTN